MLILLVSKEKKVHLSNTSNRQFKKLNSQPNSAPKYFRSST